MHISRRVLGVTLLASIAVFAFAGPLTPPVGPIAPTPGPEPRIAINAVNTPGDASISFKITQPGSYYLAGNLTGEASKHGIGIMVDGVTIDLNGFQLAGVPTSRNGIQGFVDGIKSITIRNGHVRDWGGSGVYIGGGSYGSSIGSRIENIIATGNAQTGITSGFYGTAGTIVNCTAYKNGQNGISASAATLIESCTAYDNAGNGITGSYGAVVISKCVAESNDGVGIYILYGSVIECASRSNKGDGIRVDTGCVVRGNSCAQNGSGAANDGANINVVGRDSRVEANNCTGADRGIEATDTGNIFLRNTCSGNTNNWEVVAGNRLVVVAAPSAAAVTGNSGGTALGSTDPNANYSY